MARLGAWGLVGQTSCAGTTIASTSTTSPTLVTPLTTLHPRPSQFERHHGQSKPCKSINASDVEAGPLAAAGPEATTEDPMHMTQLVLRSTRLHESMRWHNPHTTKHVGNSCYHDAYSYVDDTDRRHVASHHFTQHQRCPRTSSAPQRAPGLQAVTDACPPREDQAYKLATMSFADASLDFEESFVAFSFTSLGIDPAPPRSWLAHCFTCACRSFDNNHPKTIRGVSSA